MRRSLLSLLSLMIATNAGCAPEGSSESGFGESLPDALTPGERADPAADLDIYAVEKSKKHHTNQEVCDEKDNDADGKVDEGCDTCELFTSRNMGFWKVHACVIDGSATDYALLPQTLGTSKTFTTGAAAIAYMNASAGGSQQVILGRQLLAAKLNRAAFNLGPLTFEDVTADGNVETVDEIIALADT